MSHHFNSNRTHITINTEVQTDYHQTETSTRTENVKETNRTETKCKQENSPSPAAIEIKTITKEREIGENNYQENTEIFAENLTNSNNTKVPFLRDSNRNEEDYYFTLSSLSVKSSSSNSGKPVQKKKESIWKKTKKFFKKIKTSKSQKHDRSK
ncbi:hypothetical protein NPIL_209471 [Nephila pilipes]|uniref:Uncharacterized protein n=1 Tax=Nephila pilipes TaxID=299642 RepID=A0A8X6N2R2_NEPPI|nr:hypothetical protein NPIL_209471 [Nephila pilipes]